MTFDSRERSIATGKPVRLYYFQRGALSWAYTGADREIASGTITYAPRAISDNGIRQSGQTSADALEITGPATLEVAQLFRGVAPSDEIGITIRDIHYGETDSVVGYVGSIQSVRFPAEDRAQIVCQSLATSLETPGLRLAWMRNCTYALGDKNCQVDMEPRGVAGTVASMDGATVSASAWAAYPDGWFAGGYVQWPLGSGVYERRAVETHAGLVLGLVGGTGGINLNQALTAYPGCERTAQVCKDKFNNLLRYGGVPGLPGRSPFDGNPVF